MTKRFRADIEGLRFVAIAPILLFHLDPAFCPAGFIGVDIFFVISGYLITQMIISEGAEFQFGRFYYRRFRRLFPALLATCTACLIAGWLILSPDDYANAALSTFPSLAGVSNIYFYATVDYFNDTNLVHPLLHTWSLGVEEQFYLVWPLLIVCTARFSIPLAAMVLMALTTSLAATNLWITEDPHLVFYMMPFRIFEFAIGVCALFAHRAIKPTSNITFAFGLVGIAGIALALAFIDGQAPWPGLWSLVPVIATGLLLVGGAHPILTPVLGNPIFRFFGRISYSLYLVHWPLIVFYRYWTIIPPTWEVLVTLGVTAIALGALLHWVIEQPYRIKSTAGMSKDSLPTQDWQQRFTQIFKQFALPSIIASAAVVMAGAGAVTVKNGFPQRLDHGKVQLFDNGLTYAGDLCSYRRARCVFGDNTSTKTVYVLGDSHALNLIYGLDALFKAEHIKGIAFYDHGCLYLSGTRIFPNGILDKQCLENTTKAFEHIRSNRDPVIIANNYPMYINQSGSQSDNAPQKMDQAQWDAWTRDKFVASLNEIGVNERNVVLFNQMYSTGINLHRCLTSPAARGPDTTSEQRCAPHSLSMNRKENNATDNMIDDVAQHFPGVLVLDTKSAFCTERNCTTRDESGLYFRDAVHLTNIGSRFLIEKLSAKLTAHFENPH